MADSNVPYLDLQAQYRNLQDEIEPAVMGVLAGGAYILGQEVERFEVEFASYCESEHSVAVNSGTAALTVALRALDIGADDEVVTAANTFIATAAAIAHTGARPVLVDVDQSSRNLDPAQLERAITARTRAIIPVHLYGRPVEWDTIAEIAGRHDIPLIEDAAQAHGARCRGRRVGSLGRMAAFSFYPAKNLGACGEAGAVTTSDADLAKRMRMLRDHGSSRKYHHEVLGYNARMDAIQGAVLRVKLRHLDDWNERRRQLAVRYRELLEGLPLELPMDVTQGEQVHHVYVVACDRRDALQKHLADYGVPSIIHYPIPIHLQPAFAGLGHKAGQFPVTEKLARSVLSLPTFPEMTDEQVEYVGARVREFFERG